MAAGSNRRAKLADAEPARPMPGTGGGVVFWLLLAMSSTAFAACVWLPAWSEYEDLLAIEDAQQRRADEMQALVDDQNRLIEGLFDPQVVPGVVARLAQRDLGYVRPGEQTVRVFDDRRPVWATPSFRAGVLDASPSLVIKPRPQMSRLELLADSVFGDDETREVILILSVAVIAISFVLFGWRPTTLDAAESGDV